MVEEIGSVEQFNYTSGDIGYHVTYFESPISYKLRIGFVMTEVGVFLFRASTSLGSFDIYDHPAMYVCDGVRRSEVDVLYVNTTTSEDNYFNVFRKEADDQWAGLDIEGYYRTGAHTFYVVE